MKIIINKPFGRQAILISKDLTKISSFLVKHKIRNWIFNKTIDVFNQGSPKVTIRYTYKKLGSYISYFTK